MAKTKRSKDKKNGLRFLQTLTLFFFKRPRKTAILWLALALFGAASYGTLLNREGFPAVETPFAIARGTYFVNDPAKVDRDVADPLNNFLIEQEGIKSVQSQSQADFYSITIAYENDVNSQAKSAELSEKIASRKLLPPKATVDLEAVKFGFTERGDDLVIAFYSIKDVTDEQLNDKALAAAEFLRSKDLPLVESISTISQFQTATNPVTGETQSAQRSFDKFGHKSGEDIKFYDSVSIGLFAKPSVDNLDLNNQVQSALNELASKPEFSGYQAAISASYAPQVRAQISELQRVLLEGLIAILLVGSIVIAIRASLLTVFSMVTVLAIVNGLLYAIGYTLNTITLFSLILGLALIIDDTIIMVEALDAQRRRQKKAADAVKVAVSKVSKAMVAATLTAMLSFAPLIFVGGILGDFIRAIPITIISALFVSLVVALVFIPLFAKFLLLSEGQMSKAKRESGIFGIEHKIAEFLAKPMLLARGSRKKLASTGAVAILIGFAFISAGGYLFQKVTFDIFPASKDTNQITVSLGFAENTTIQSAEMTADKANKIIGDTLGQNFIRASYNGMADPRAATLTVDLIDYKDREITSAQLIDSLNERFAEFNEANVDIRQVGPGPPPAAFAVRIDSGENRKAALKLAEDVKVFLEQTELKRLDGSTAEIKTVSTTNGDTYLQADGKSFIEVNASFVDNDTTTLVTLAQDAVEKEFTAKRVASYGLAKDSLDFSFGQEDENQESFKTLAISFPIILVIIYILLAIQFRSLIQPLLIFMAIPFSLFGITLGLYLTDNPFSFFALLGFFALIGLSIKNTILLVDSANQSRRRGLGPVDAIHEALAERFRPLIATSFTAVVSLIPLALTSPFWEGLTVVLIFGLLSSTFLVVTVFPYYYLAGEYLRQLKFRSILNGIRDAAEVIAHIIIPGR
ncbi:MAG TPA: efflux RND transporter permease subunit [Candidatus Saccharimonadales bacterium]|nr:efflux RND transporter permease subunit [Candidatus Saccharimonadales bacterium]